LNIRGSCITRGRGDKKCKRFWWQRPKERDHTEDRGVDGRMGSEWILRTLPGGGGGVEWIQLAQDKDWWRALVNTVLNLRVPAPRSWLTMGDDVNMETKVST
jgi:hypothetical protein